LDHLDKLNAGKCCLRKTFGEKLRKRAGMGFDVQTNPKNQVGTTKRTTWATKRPAWLFIDQETQAPPGQRDTAGSRPQRDGCRRMRGRRWDRRRRDAASAFDPMSYQGLFNALVVALVGIWVREFRAMVEQSTRRRFYFSDAAHGSFRLARWHVRSSVLGVDPSDSGTTAVPGTGRKQKLVGKSMRRLNQHLCFWQKILKLIIPKTRKRLSAI